MVAEKQYWSQRQGRSTKIILSLSDTIEMIKSTTQRFLFKNKYFEDSFSSDVDFKHAVILTFGKSRFLYPFFQWAEDFLEYDENDLFDVLEFMYEYCAAPWDVDYYFGNLQERKEIGRQELRDAVNKILAKYGDGYELSENGQILSLPEDGFEKIFEAKIASDNPRIVDPVQNAIVKFRHRSTLSDRKEAIRSLGDVLEHIRNDVKKVLTKKDESDLFDMLNNFGIRHHNNKQKTEYDEDIFYSWMFYHYLASIHACTRLIERAKQ
jgi:hypothetical protein